MKIKRGLSYLGAARKYRVYINGKIIDELKLKQQIDVEVPVGEFELHFETMRLEKSMVYTIKSMGDLEISVNINPMVRLMYLALFVLMMSFVFFGNVFDWMFPIALLASVLTLILHFGYFYKRYLVIKINENSTINSEDIICGTRLL